jgi:hypothetical protein
MEPAIRRERTGSVPLVIRYTSRDRNGAAPLTSGNRGTGLGKLADCASAGEPAADRREHACIWPNGDRQMIKPQWSRYGTAEHEYERRRAEWQREAANGARLN